MTDPISTGKQVGPLFGGYQSQCVNLPTPNAKQLSLILLRRQQRWTDIGFGGHVRGSKTYGSFLDLTVAALVDFPGDTFLVLRQDHGALQLWYFDKYLEILPPQLVASSRRTAPMEIQFVNGSRVLFLHAKNVMKFMGSSLRGVYIDEAHEVAPSVLSALYTRLTTLRGQSRYCYVVQMVNPCPGHFYEHFYAHRDNVILPNGIRYRDSDGGVIFIPSKTEDNVALGTPDDIARMKARARAKMPEADYLRYYEGSWDTFIGKAFSAFNPFHHVKKIGVTTDELGNGGRECDVMLDGTAVKWIAGLDYGVTNPTCFMLFCYDEDGPLYGVNGFYETKLGIIEIYDRILALFDRYRVPPEQRIVLYDPSMNSRHGFNDSLRPIEPLVRRSASRRNVDGDVEIAFVPGFNRGGIELLNEQLAESALFLDERMSWAVSEINGAMMEPPSVLTHARRDSPDRLQRKNDHSIDVLRYVLQAKVLGRFGSGKVQLTPGYTDQSSAPLVRDAMRRFYGVDRDDSFYGCDTTYDATGGDFYAPRRG